jgi:hypothetical protein
MDFVIDHQNAFTLQSLCVRGFFYWELQREDRSLSLSAPCIQIASLPFKRFRTVGQRVGAALIAE